MPATACADQYEPNDGITQAFGPLASGATYTGDFHTDNDDDWFVLYTSGQGAIHITLNRLGGDVGVFLRLKDAFGSEIYSTNSYGSTGTIDYTAPGPGRYYVNVSSGCCDHASGTQYRFSISGPLTSGPPALPVVTTSEPNDKASQAVGPLSSSVSYDGLIDTDNDVDWFKFNTSGRTAVTLTSTLLSGPCNANVRIYGSSSTNSDALASVYAEEDEFAQANFTAPKAHKYYVVVTPSSEQGCTGSKYRFDLAGNFAAKLLTPKQKKCASAKTAIAKYNAKIKATKKAIKKAHGHKKRSLKKKLKSQRKSLTAQKKRKKKYC